MNLVATRWWSTLLLPSGLLFLGLAAGLLLLFAAWRAGRRPAQARLACLLTGTSALLLYLACGRCPQAVSGWVGAVQALGAATPCLAVPC